MSESRPPASPSRGLWILIIVLLIPPVVLPLWVPLYDKTEPELNGWPFFYWFQMALILFATVMTVIAFALSRVADRKDREARGQQPDAGGRSGERRRGQRLRLPVPRSSPSSASPPHAGAAPRGWTTSTSGAWVAGASAPSSRGS